MRRICLFAGFDKQNKIHDYVIYFAKQLSKISDVYYCGNGDFSPEELFKIAPFTKMFYGKKHNLKDFGSWQYMINCLGWEKISQYDELLLCNDSVYGPLFNLENVFWKMEHKHYDFWSITSDYEYNFHLHRYFSVFNQNVIINSQFQKFWQTIPFYYNAHTCELELTPLLTNSGFIGNSYIRNYKTINQLREPKKLLSEYHIPFIKVKNFLPENKYSAENFFGLRYKIKKQTDYNLSLINKHLRINGFPQNWKQKISLLTGL